MSTWEHVLADGSTEEITLEGVMASGSLTHLSNAPEVIEGAVTPPPMTVRALGMYNGSWADFSGDPDGQAKAVFGHQPAVASSYYTTNQQPNVAKETSRVNRGISPLISVSTNGTQRLTGIVNGNTADRAWLDQYLDALNAISLADPNVPVYATIDQEYDVRTTDHTATGGSAPTITGGDANPAVYGGAMSYTYNRAATRCPLVRMGLWIGGSTDQRSKNLTILQNIAVPFAWGAVDPYAQSGTSPQTAWAQRLNDWRTGTFSTEYARLNALAGFTIPLCVSETGINKAKVNDATMAAWIGNLPDAIENSDLLWCVYFNRDSGSNGDWRIDGGTFQPRPLSVAAMGNALLTVNGR